MGPSRGWRSIAPFALAGLLALAGARGAHAQQTPPAPAPRDSAAAPGDTTAADTSRAAPRPLDPAVDSVLNQLKKLPGYTATEYQGENAVYRAEEGVLRLQGTAQVEREGDRLTADTIIYRSRTDLVEAYGDPTVTGEQQELQGQTLFYDLARHRATAIGARTQVTQSATWFVNGDVTLEGTHRVYATKGTFTTCDLDIPHYHFESDKIKVIKNKILVARPARLYFGKVPVMVLPFVVQNLERGRRSGLLVPRFGINDIVRPSAGYTREISDLGWYWAINDYLGAQLSGTWRSGAYTALQGDLQFRWRRQFLSGNASVRHFWEEDGGRNFNVNSGASWQPDERTNLSLNASFATSSRFVRRTTYDPREVTQNLMSSLSTSRRFDWGSLSLGATRSQAISDESVDMTLPQFGLNVNTITLFRAATPEQARWFSNLSFTPTLSGTRQIRSGHASNLLPDNTTSQYQTSLPISMGNLSLGFSGSLNRSEVEALRVDSLEIDRPAYTQDVINLASNIGYQIRLIGSSRVTPNVSISQAVRRDTVTQRLGSSYVGGPRRVAAGASVSADVFGFFPGVGGYSAIRHRFSPTLSYNYVPSVNPTALQRQVFGEGAGSTQSLLTLSFNQTFEAKLRDPTPDAAQRDTAGIPAAGDTTRAGQRESTPAEPQKVTLLSISTSSFSYDFAEAARGGSGLQTTTVSNSITSDYLKGLTIQVQHQLFDPVPGGVDTPLPGTVGGIGGVGSGTTGQLGGADDPGTIGEIINRPRVKHGKFHPRLSSLSTGFELGPGSAIFRWLGLREDARNPQTQGEVPGPAPSDEPRLPGQGAATGNPRSTGGGPWRLGVNYSFSRQTFYESQDRLRSEGVQTADLAMSFPLTPNWAMSWNTMYSITDGQFSGHRLNFRRNLHRWNANFDFYQAPTGFSGFVFSVALTDLPDLHTDYRDSNLGIDRRR